VDNTNQRFEQLSPAFEIFVSVKVNTYFLDKQICFFSRKTHYMKVIKIYTNKSEVCVWSLN